MNKARKRSFKPAWWLSNRHLQTLWPVFCRRRIQHLSIKPQRVELSDGDFIDLCWVGEGAGPIVLILHGLEGSMESHYAKGMLHAIQQQGWRGVFMHFRGCSGEPNRLPRSYHSGETTDVAAVVNKIRESEPDTQLAAIGFSLGGNVLLKWLGETGKDNPLDAAIAVSVPFELQKSVQYMMQGFSKIYHQHLLKSLCKRVFAKFSLQTSHVKLPERESIKTIYDFDDKITGPLHGFSDAADYYTRSSSRQYLSAIQVPTLLIQAQDDPFMPKDVIPQPQELSSFVQLELSASGGHVGFVAGKFPWRPEYWLEMRAPEFLHEHLK